MLPGTPRKQHHEFIQALFEGFARGIDYLDTAAIQMAVATQAQAARRLIVDGLVPPVPRTLEVPALLWGRFVRDALTRSGLKIRLI